MTDNYEPNHARNDESNNRRNLPVEHVAPTALSTNVLHSGYDPMEEDTIDLREYWNVIMRRRWSVLATLAAVVIVVLFVSLIQTPIYRATTLLQIERETGKVLEFEDASQTEKSGDKDFYLTQYELLKSNSLAQRVVDELNLNPKKDQQENQGLVDWVIALFNSTDGKEEAALNDADLKEVSREKIAKIRAFQAALTVEPVRNSRLVKVSFDHPDPILAARIANAVAQNFISMNLEKKFEANAYAKKFLEERIQQVKQKLEEAEKAQVAYAREHKIFNIGSEGGTTSSQNLEGFNEAAAKAEQDRIKAEALYRQMNASRPGELPLELENSLIQQLKASKAKLEADYQDKLKTFKPGYPAMQEMAGQIQELTQQISKEIASVRVSVKNSYEAAKAHEDLMREKLNSSKSEVLDLQSRSIQFNILKREADTNRTLYEGLLQRLKEVSVAGGVGANNMIVVDKAEIPNSKFKPNVSLNLLIALFIGLFGGVGLAFFLEHLDDTFKSGDEIERTLGLPLLGIIPEGEQIDSHVDTLKQLLEDPRSPVAEAFRSARTALQFSTAEGTPKVLGLTSSTMSEGKSTAALCLAINYTQCGYSVLLIDADLRKPSMHKAFGIDNKVGLTNLLTGMETMTNVVKKTSIDNLYFIPTGFLPPNPAELLQGTRMRQLIEVAREKFDLVIFDGPPILGLADALVLGNAVDRFVLVIKAGTTQRTAVKTALKRLKMARIKPLGTILNKLGKKHVGYGYDYHYSYYAYGEKQDKKSKKTG